MAMAICKKLCANHGAYYNVFREWCHEKEEKSMDRHNCAGGGLGLCGTLTVIFTVLKLVGVIEWSWLLVLAPTWIPATILGLVLIWAAKFL